MVENNVLFVDDEPLILKAIKRVLRKQPFKAHYADGGHQALALMERQPIQVIVSDLLMPEMDGLTLLKEVQKRYPETIRIVMSAVVDINPVLEAFHEGRIYRYIVKPYDERELLEIVDQAVNHWCKQQDDRDLSRKVQQKLQRMTNELECIQTDFNRAKIEASVDFLTGVGNRKAFKENLDLLSKKAADEDTPMSMLALDIDHFKSVNDKHGHNVGDEVLKLVAQKIKINVRGKDLIARYGGEEFAVLLPATPLGGASMLAENIRKSFSQDSLQLSETSKSLCKITVSIGTAEYRPGENLENFVNRADKALYHAKNNGRNNVATEIDLKKDIFQVYDSSLYC